MLTKEYVIYLRKSSEDKNKQIQSLGDQLEACLEYAKNNNLTIKKRLLDFSAYETEKDIEHENNLKDRRDRKLFRDTRDLFIVKESFSGKDSGERKRWSALTKYLLEQEGRVGLISYSPDRQSRNLVEAGQLIELVENTGMELRYPTFHFENNTSGKMMLGIWFVLSKQYVDNLKEVSGRGTISAYKKGTAIGYNKHGYTINEEKYHEPNEDFELIRKAFDMKLYDGKTNEQIIRYLNAKGYKYKHGKNMIPISSNTIATVFNDSFYYGLFKYNEETIDLNNENPYFKPIISLEEFNKLTAITQKDKSKKTLSTRKEELEGLYPFKRGFITTEDNYIASIYIPSFDKRFPDRLKKRQEKNPKLKMIDIIEPHQFKIKVGCKKSTIFPFECSYADIEKEILIALKSIKISDEQYEEYLGYVKLGYKQKREKNINMRKTLQIQRNNIEKELNNFVTNCLGKERDEIQEEAYQKEVNRLTSLIESLDSDIDEINIEGRDQVFEFQIIGNFIRKAEEYYLKANYVQKRKINNILFSNIKITPKKVLVIPRQELEDIFNHKWQAH